jgi:hypothetical protein
VLCGISIDCLVGSAVNRKIGLAITNQIESLHIDRAFDWILEDAGADLSFLPDHQAGPSDIHRDDTHRSHEHKIRRRTNLIR